VRAEISTCEVYGSARFALCCYESTFGPTNGKTESFYMQIDWVTVNVFVNEVGLQRTEMLELKFKKMQIFLFCEMLELACGSGKPD
jgi:hypothetical protein